MTWIKLDDNAVDHPKVESLSDRAFRWWVRGLSYASRFLTDGVLPPVFWKKVPTPSREELSDQRLWDWHDPNFQIHDYHHHQSRREDVEDTKQRNREKAAKYRAKMRAERLRVTGDVTGDWSPKIHGDATNPENREQRTEIHPLTPANAGRPLTRKERDWAEALRKEHGCPHTPVCGDEYTCVGILVGHKREAERDGLRKAAS